MTKEIILTAVIASGMVAITTTATVTLKAARVLLENYLNDNNINYSGYANIDTVTGNDGITTIFADIEIV